jgi:hypothetical protein
VDRGEVKNGSLVPAFLQINQPKDLFQADARVSSPYSFEEVCDAISAKLKCLDSHVGRCLNEQGRHNLR